MAEVKAFKANRQVDAVQRTLRVLYQATKSGSNVSRPIIEAVKTGVTIGEVTGTIRAGYGLPYDPFEQIEMPEFLQQIVNE